MSKIEVNTVEPQCGTTLTLGACGDTVALGSGAAQTGFGRTGTVDWITTPKVTGDSPITGVTGKGYFLNTTSGEITFNLPAGAAGSIVSMADYAATWQTNKVTVVADGSEKIGGLTNDALLNVEGQSVTLVYVDSTQGWLNTMDSTSNVRGLNPYIVASGGNTTITCGDYKTHIFTGPGALCFSSAGTPAGADTVEYLVVAGGGGSGDGSGGGGGGAGGYRENYPSPATGGLTISATPYTITVGGGGAFSTSPAAYGIPGSDSTFSSITSTGGGSGTSETCGYRIGLDGGSGGGGLGYSSPYAGGSGNVPATPVAQGNDGGVGGSSYNGGGGGGATTAGGIGYPGPGLGGVGGPLADAFFGPTAPSYGTPGPAPSTRYFAGGGGGGVQGGSPPRLGGAGGGGTGALHPSTQATAGTVNTGGGGGGGFGAPTQPCGSGGSGIVAIRYKFQ